jgi:PTS system nitrogen regulatory IIA component
MEIADILAPQGVFPRLKAASKKKLLVDLAQRAATMIGGKEEKIFETLWEREKLATTGVGHGVAIPHGRLPKLERITGLFARLEEALEFDAVDDAPVDLVFLLLAPEDAGADHLKALARVSRLMRNVAICEKLRVAPDKAALYALLTEPTATFQAA